MRSVADVITIAEPQIIFVLPKNINILINYLFTCLKLVMKKPIQFVWKDFFSCGFWNLEKDWWTSLSTKSFWQCENKATFFGLFKSVSTTHVKQSSWTKRKGKNKRKCFVVNHFCLPDVSRKFGCIAVRTKMFKWNGKDDRRDVCVLDLLPRLHTLHLKARCLSIATAHLSYI